MSKHHPSSQPQPRPMAEPGLASSSIRRDGDSDDDSIVDNRARVGGEGEAGRRKRRGRPLGSKNKPKLPIINAQGRDSLLPLPRVLECPNGSDIFASLAAFARRRQLGVRIISGTGAVANVTLRQSFFAGAVLMLQGRFVIMSLTGQFLPPPAPPTATGLTICVANGEGQVVGGRVVRPLIASGCVLILAATSANATYVRLPLAEEDLQVTVHHGHGYPPPGQPQRPHTQSAADDRSQQTAYPQLAAEPTQFQQPSASQ